MRTAGRDRTTALSKQQSKLTIKLRLYRAALPRSYVVGARSGRSCAIYVVGGGGGVWVESCRCCWFVRVCLQGRNSSICIICVSTGVRVCVCMCTYARECALWLLSFSRHRRRRSRDLNIAAFSGDFRSTTTETCVEIVLFH